jgi:protein-S-isoprenylcysteine O-methyltransferase Ste14
MMTSAVPLVFVILAIVVLGVTGNLFSASPIVIAVQVAAIALNIWARRSFDAGTFRVSAEPGGTAVIRRGPYRFIRHPMYTSALLFIWAAILSHRSTFTLAIGAIVTVIAVLRVFAEERLLRAKYADYVDYARVTRALMPFIF